MKKPLVILFLILSSSLLTIHAQNWYWARQGTGPMKPETSAYVATNESGDVYMAGHFSAPAIFKPDTLMNGFSDAFYLIKYNNIGTVLWAAQPLVCTESSCYGVATDNSDNAYITGSFGGGPFQFGSVSLSTGSGEGLLLAKYTPAGNPVWGDDDVSIHGSATGMGVATDVMGHVYVTGNFADTITIGTYTLKTFRSSSNVFIAKYDTAGHAIWAKQAVGPSQKSIGKAYSVAADLFGNTYITGYFIDTISFGSNTLISNLGNSVYLVKYSAAGNVLWAKQSKLSSVTNTYGYSVTTDPSGSVYITGAFTDSVNFDGKKLFSLYGSFFLTKYDSNGNVSWALQSSSGLPHGEQGTSVVSNGGYDVFLAGVCGDSLRCKGLLFEGNLSGESSSFLIKFDTAGNPICGNLVDGLGNCFGSDPFAPASVAADGGGFVYLASTFYNGNVYWGSDTSFIRSGFDDIGLGRWKNCIGAGIDEATHQAPNTVLYPNPNSGQFTLEVKSEELRTKNIVEVYNMLGEKIYTTKLNATTTELDLSNNASGIYLYRVLTETGTLVSDGKFVIQK
ncbi:MAG TPA: T9SS type A sorting domain-containing protein [Bacteroidia bacterium]|jgi:hypothetical protein|nr:T9SS type A sorting domain-containing protein [Bacteroidia bacterium]